MKKFLPFLLAAACCFSFAACNFSGNDPVDPIDPDPNPSDPVDPDPVDPDPVDPQIPAMNDLVKNFWETDTMYDESVLFVAETDAEGNVISAPKAKLLFGAEEILSAVQYYTGTTGGKKTFAPGQDFTYQDGYLTATGTLSENAITEKTEFVGTVPYVTDRQLSGQDPFPGLGGDTSIPSTDSGLYLPFTEGAQIVQQQISVTYRHKGGWTGAKPAFQGEALAGTIAKLKAKETVELFVYGDSISTGANSSSVLNVEPFLETWPELVAKNLSSYYGGTVNLTNKSVGGWTSENGVSGGTGWVGGKQIQQDGLQKLLKGELAGYKPDIAFIGFGMNDASMGLDINAYINNLAAMINTIRTANPGCEIVLVGTMLANPKALNQSKNQTEFTAAYARITERIEKCCVVDVGAMHADILAAGKRYTEISSNNVNHPNDFMARVYAMNLLSALIEGEKSEENPPARVKGENAAYEGFIDRGYNALFADPYFKNGVSVTTSAGESGGALRFKEGTKPSWNLSQWGSKFDLTETAYGNVNYSKGGDAVVYSSDGKLVNGSKLPAKVLSLDSVTGQIGLELNTEVEYDHARADGESWPHILLSQDFGGNLVKVSALTELIMDMDYTVTKCEDRMNGEADPNAHCAQLVWYITLQNRTAGSKGYGQYLWFGLTLWDNRMEGTESNIYAAQDLGKADATQQFIYKPSSTDYLAGKKIPTVGQRASANFSALKAARAAFDLAKKRGYLPDTSWEDIYIGAMNFGFENTGTYNSAAVIETVGVYYK